MIKKHLPSHTFLVYFQNNKVYWFEHSWYDKKGIHEYNNLTELLDDVEKEFVESRINEVSSPINVYIYKYTKPKFNISCDEFYNYIFTQETIINYKLENATSNDLERIKKYKLNTIFQYANDLSEEEKNKIIKYVNEDVCSQINNYQNIIYNDNIVGSILIKNIDDGLLIDEIFIEEKYRNKGIGTSVLNNIISNETKNIFLWVYKENIKAINLYKKLGFTIIQETQSRYYMLKKV